jgi:hypothetical protein
MKSCASRTRTRTRALLPTLATSALERPSELNSNPIDVTGFTFVTDYSP